MATRRPFFVGLLGVSFLAVISCSCWWNNKPTQSVQDTQARVYYVGVVSLYRSYQDSSNRWNNQKIRVELPKGSYVIRNNKIEWSSRLLVDSPDCVFECLAPEDNTNDLVIIGSCQGKYPYPSSQGWIVLISDCTVSIR